MIRTLCLSLVLTLAGSGIAQTPPTAPAQHSSHAPSHAAPSAAEVWDSLMAGNRRIAARNATHNRSALPYELGKLTVPDRRQGLCYR